MKLNKLLILSIPLIVSAQSDLYPVEDYFGGGIGYSPMYMMLDSIPGTNQLKKVGLNPDDFNNPFVVHGGEGFTQISGRWRLGGYAGIGTSRISNALSVILAIDNNGLAGIQDTITPAQGGSPQYAADRTESYTGIFVPTVEAKFTFMISSVTMEYVVPIFRELEVASAKKSDLLRGFKKFDKNKSNSRAFLTAFIEKVA